MKLILLFFAFRTTVIKYDYLYIPNSALGLSFVSYYCKAMN